MSDTARYYSTIKRQNAKLSHAPKVKRAFERSVRDLGPNPSFTELARWLNAKKVPPSANAKPNASWAAQTVRDWLEFDGIDPSEQNLRTISDEAAALNKSGRRTRMRDFGFRCSAKHTWNQVKATVRVLEGEERCKFQEEKLEQHLIKIFETADGLRRALHYKR